MNEELIVLESMGAASEFIAMEENIMGKFGRVLADKYTAKQQKRAEKKVAHSEIIDQHKEQVNAAIEDIKNLINKLRKNGDFALYFSHSKIFPLKATTENKGFKKAVVYVDILDDEGAYAALGDKADKLSDKFDSEVRKIASKHGLNYYYQENVFNMNIEFTV